MIQIRKVPFDKKVTNETTARMWDRPKYTDKSQAYLCFSSRITMTKRSNVLVLFNNARSPDVFNKHMCGHLLAGT